MIASVDWAALLEVVWSSMVSGIALVVVASLGILGAARAGTLRRDGERMAATAYGTLAVVCALACLAGVAFGVSVMLQKG
jgi:hypothetical protein